MSILTNRAMRKTEQRGQNFNHVAKSISDRPLNG